MTGLPTHATGALISHKGYNRRLNRLRSRSYNLVKNKCH